MIQNQLCVSATEVATEATLPALENTFAELERREKALVASAAECMMWRGGAPEEPVRLGFDGTRKMGLDNIDGTRPSGLS